jgi:hypothetical protein
MKSANKLFLGMALTWLLAVLLAAPAFAQSEGKTVILSIGEIRDLAAPFTIKSFVPGNRDLVRVQSDGAEKLTVTALKEGNTDIKVTGVNDETLIYKVTIGSSLEAVMSELRKDLENIPGVEAEVGLGKVVLRGVITRPKDWSYLKKTVLPTYGDQVQCKVQFRLQDEMLLKLKQGLEQANFKVVEGNKAKEETGTLNLFASDNNVFINGSVYARGDLDSVRSVVNSCSWLTIRKEGDKVEDDACYAVVNVEVAPVLLEVDVSFVGVSDDETLQIGANLLKSGLGVLSGSASIAGSAIHGQPTSTADYLVSASLGDTIKALGGGGPKRFSSIGHLTLKNDSTDWKIFKDGGTINLPISGGLNGTASLAPIDYGFIIKAKGGLTDPQNAQLDIQVEMSVPVLAGRSQSGPIYDKKETRLESTIACPVGKTLIMGGTKQLTEGITIESETPILGKLPGLQFLFSDRKKDKTARQVLILVSPQMAKAPTSAAPVSDQTADTQEKAAKPISVLKPNLR